LEIAEAVTAVFAKYAVFTGRSSRPEFWWWILFSYGVFVVLHLAKVIVSPIAGVLEALWSLATLIPNISVAVRRLHDSGRSGWWWLLSFVPIVGWLVLIYWYCQPGTPRRNQYDL